MPSLVRAGRGLPSKGPRSIRFLFTRNVPPVSVWRIGLSLIRNMMKYDTKHGSHVSCPHSHSQTRLHGLPSIAPCRLDCRSETEQLAGAIAKALAQLEEPPVVFTEGMPGPFVQCCTPGAGSPGRHGRPCKSWESPSSSKPMSEMSHREGPTVPFFGWQTAGFHHSHRLEKCFKFLACKRWPILAWWVLALFG